MVTAMGPQARLPGQQQEPDGSAAATPPVLAAIELGWCMAELYAKVKPDTLQPPEAPDAPLPQVSPAPEPPRSHLQEDLPGLGSLPDRQELQLLIDRVNVGYRQLELVSSHAGLAVAAPADWVSLTYQRAAPEGRYQLARSVLQFHTDLFVALTACAHQVGLAWPTAWAGRSPICRCARKRTTRPRSPATCKAAG